MSDNESPATAAKNPNSWVGVDLDGTLAEYHGWKGPEHIGEPVAPMLERVKLWLAEGLRVKIVTARAADLSNHAIIHAWLLKHGLPVLEVTDRKDFHMAWLWDDRAVAVTPNSGIAHYERERFMREDLHVVALAAGVVPERNEHPHNLALRLVQALRDTHAEADAALDMLLHVRADKFKGGDGSQAFKDVCMVRRNLQAIMQRHAKAQKEERPNAQ